MNWQQIRAFFEYEIISETKGGFHLDTLMLMIAILAFVATRFIFLGLKRIITRSMEDGDKLKFDSIFKYVNYVAYIIVFFVLLQNSGVNLTTIFAASAALFVGIGFALQDFFKDIIGGITILTDKSIQVHDVIELDGKVGRVFEVKLRSTRIVTRDDKILIIPNHLFLAEVINNHTQNHSKTRENVTVGVAYGTDTESVRDLLLECANKQRGVLKSPESLVIFSDFGQSSLDFVLYFYVRDSFTSPRVKSDLRYAIDKTFRENNITIPFPQRDLHIINRKDDSQNKLATHLGLD
jgi:small-conductance mechanosensitive channel